MVNLAVFAMGTRFEFVLVGEDESHLRAVGEEAVAEIQYLHEKFSYFSKSSIVTRINQRAAIQPVDLDRETFDLLTLCRVVWERSGGAFDITIAPLMHHFGFRSSSEALLSGGGPPPSFSFGMQHLALDAAARTVRFALPGITIDLGAIAKGYALDRAAAVCRENGVACGLLHGGTSTAVALGAPPTEERGWGVKIHDERETLTVHLRDRSLSVSAPRGRTAMKDGVAHSHIIDPRNGKPAIGATTAVVIAHEATLADAWSTALLVLNERPHGMPESFVSMIRDGTRGWRHSGGSNGRAPLCVAAERAS